MDNQDPIQAEPPRVRPLKDYCMFVILGHIDTITSLGEMPYRLAKPILERCLPEKMLDIEQNSPHLKEDNEEIWRDICVYRFNLSGKEDYSDERSWREYYLDRVEQEKKLEEEAGLRLRSKRESLNAKKQERQIRVVPAQFKAHRTGWNKTPAPKTLMQKARTETKKIANLYNAKLPRPIRPIPTATGKSFAPFLSSRGDPTRGPSSSTAVPSRASGSGTDLEEKNPTHGKPLWDFGRKEVSSVVVTTTSKSVKSSALPNLGKKADFSARLNEDSARPPSFKFEFSPPSDAPSYPITRAPSPTKSRHPPSAKPAATSPLFMPKHKAFSQIPSSSRTEKSRR